MKRICIITFSERAYRLGERILHCFQQEDPEMVPELLCKTEALPELSDPRSLREICRDCFQDREVGALLFLSATGIAVRGIAPFLRHKSRDPAVLCMDEEGHYCIPLLSGHLGGANELAEKLSGWIGAEAVLTTASDVEGRFSIDLFAKANGLEISDHSDYQKAREIASRVLRGIRIRIYQEPDLDSVLSARPLQRMPGEEEAEWLPADRAEEADVCIGFRLPQNVAHSSHSPASSWRESGEPSGLEEGRVPEAAHPLRALPPVGLVLWAKCIYVGIGTRKGVEEAEVEEAVQAALAREGISPVSVAALCSIDRKRTEQGILAYAYRRDIPFLVYTAEQLAALEGAYAHSDFVAKVVGIGNVCERAAVLGAGRGGRLLSPKSTSPRVTIALAIGCGLPPS